MRNSLVFLLLIGLLLSCDDNRMFDTYQTIPNQWGKENKVTFKFKNIDTINKYNLFINIRNNNSYEFSNLYLIVNLKSPSNNQTIDTLAYEMAKPSGEWLGTGFSVKENKLFFKEKIRFKEHGQYAITIAHAMRKNGSVLGVEVLNGITEVGFRIEKITKQ